MFYSQLTGQGVCKQKRQSSHNGCEISKKMSACVHRLKRGNFEHGQLHGAVEAR
ncbi:unnamed protein product [Chondrus crispus]|uniref:Uncharacterized protein n=1 Tax=Chondrus crispus TaxID=2769 RepID=R7QMY4_CHOCR|nr:unnamed protein product [Chondrus crispus]CDF39128.1 unnamed protein product [Chondrus crispus]|eukprot:XP_005719039.1 unnamed protein product [Chondrus crispus]